MFCNHLDFFYKNSITLNQYNNSLTVKGTLNADNTILNNNLETFYNNSQGMIYNLDYGF